MNAALRESRYAELLDERSLFQALLEIATKEWSYWAGRNSVEFAYWAERRHALRLELSLVNSSMRAVLSDEDKDRYADERESARREDAECNGARNATDWSRL